MAKFRTDTLMWLLIDANSPLSAGNNDLVGPVGAEPMTKQGELFYHFLQTHNLAVPSTFPHLHTCQSTTWTHTSGRKSRKDYVLLPVSDLPLVKASWVVIDHDNNFAHEDHLPAAISFQGWLPVMPAAPPSNGMKRHS